MSYVTENLNPSCSVAEEECSILTCSYFFFRAHQISCDVMVLPCCCCSCFHLQYSLFPLASAALVDEVLVYGDLVLAVLASAALVYAVLVHAVLVYAVLVDVALADAVFAFASCVLLGKA
eukprot:scaffold11313_cov144-Skeletonema_marinoi.AAC.8